MKILLLKNCPVVYLSYLLEHLNDDFPDSIITVLSHQHAVENVRSLAYVDDVVSFCGDDILNIREVCENDKAMLFESDFDLVCFYVGDDGLESCENLVSVARKVVSNDGGIVGVTLQGDVINIGARELSAIYFGKAAGGVFSLIIFSILVIFAPFLFLLSFIFNYKNG